MFFYGNENYVVAFVFIQDCSLLSLAKHNMALATGKAIPMEKQLKALERKMEEQAKSMQELTHIMKEMMETRIKNSDSTPTSFATVVDSTRPQGRLWITK